MIRALEQPIEEIADIDLLRKHCREKGVTEISGCLDSQKAHLALGLKPEKGAALLVAENELKARQLFEDCRLF